METPILNNERIRENGKMELLEILEALRGHKCLVIDLYVGNLLNHIIPEGSKILKENGVQYFRELRGELGDFVTESGRDLPDHIVYLTRPSIAHMKIIAKQIQIQKSSKSGIRSQFHVYFIPHRSVACEQMLEDEGVLDMVTIGEYRLGFVPLDTDILSLEMIDLYHECCLNGDSSSLSIVVHSLQKLQSLFGNIPEIKCKGTASRKVLQKLIQHRKDEASLHRDGSHDPLSDVGQIHSLVLIDRDVDPYSVLLTPLTYEGLVDEVLHIENGRVKLDAALFGESKEANATPGAPPIAEAKRGEKVSLSLNNTDHIFSEIRNLSIEALGNYLQDKAVTVRKLYSDFRDNKDASLAEIHDFVKKIPQLTKEYKSLDQHIHIAELLKKTTDSPDFRELWQTERGILEGDPLFDVIEEMVCSDYDRIHLYKCFRLLCLLSLTCGGIKSNKYDQIRRLMIQIYGYPLLFTFANLEKVGLLRRKEVLLLDTSSASSPLWTSVRRNLRLINEGVDVAHPNDMSYVTAGYAPLLVRLVEALGTPGGWNALSEVIKQLPGPFAEFDQSKIQGNGHSFDSESYLPVIHSFADEDDLAVGPTIKKKIMMVCVIGGISFLEVAAMRYLSNEPSFPYTILIATTALVNGRTFLESLSHQF